MIEAKSIFQHLSDWVESSMKMPGPANVPRKPLRGIIPGAAAPQGCTTEAYKPYRFSTTPGTVPDIPQPYETFADTFSYGCGSTVK